MTNQRTGLILPRSYGLRLAMPQSMPDVFISPASYILGQIMLETPGEIRNRVRDWADRYGKNYEESLDALVDGVLKREETKNILNFSRKTESRQVHELTLQNMRHYGGNFTGEVKSKGREGYYSFSLPEPHQRRDCNISYPGARVGNDDNLWNEGKGKNMSVIGVHLAIPEIALAMDYETRMSQRANMTGLAPKDRKMSFVPNLPFTFNKFKSPGQMSENELVQYRLVTDLFMDYYTNGISQYDLSIVALKNPIFSEELKKAIFHPKDRARFKVLRQREEEKKKEDLSTAEARHYASVVKLLDGIKTYFEKEWDYVPSGYMREFPDSDWETVARRFEPKGEGPVYSVSVVGKVPVLVRRYLDHRTDKWVDSSDNRFHPLKRLRGKYNSIDDVTRRDSVTEVVLPDKPLKKAGIYIPQNLQEIYDSLR
jgi:hypothetical protein